MARCIGLEKDKKLLQSELEKWENNAEHLVSDYPELVRQWSEKNGLLKPEKVTMGSNRKIWWVCEKGHEWQAPVYSRTHGNGCPVCSNRKILPGYNDLATLHPELVKQWGFARNGDLKPDMIGRSGGSARKGISGGRPLPIGPCLDTNTPAARCAPEEPALKISRNTIT